MRENALQKKQDTALTPPLNEVHDVCEAAVDRAEALGPVDLLCLFAASTLDHGRRF